MKKFLFLFVFFLSLGLQAQETTEFKLSIYFETASSELTTDSKLKMDIFTNTLLDKPDFDIRIEANTDDRGTIEYNQDLAEKRAQSTFNYLLSKNVNPRSSIVKNYGETNQKWLNDIELRRKENRRVDLIATIYYFSSLSSIRDRLLQSEPQEKTSFANSEGKTLTTFKGTVLEIPEDAFVFEDGSIPTGQIDFQVKEAYKASDWFLNSLSTETSGGKLLQTAGMVFTSASSEGKSVKIKKGKSISIAVPTPNKPMDGMELFYGEQHDQTSGVTWKPTVSARNIRRSNIHSIRFSKKLNDFLKTLEFDVPKNPTPINYTTLVFPLKPISPRKPTFRSKKPKREDFTFIAYSFMDKLKSKKEKEAIAQKKFDKNIARYEKNITRHENRMKEYEQNQKKYRLACEKYQKEIEEWENEAYNRLFARHT